MTCILQCLIHCVPLQKHFLRDVGHHHKSCEIIRGVLVRNDATVSTTGSQSTSSKVAGKDQKKLTICLACEMDKLFLQYQGSSIGRDVKRAVCQGLHPDDYYENSLSAANSSNSARGKSGDTDGAGYATVQGDPLVTTKLLAAAWKSSGMDHLAGYEQGDAHEFLQAFLDTIGKHEGECRKLIRFMQRMALPANARNVSLSSSGKHENGTFQCCKHCFLVKRFSYFLCTLFGIVDIIKQLFEGTLRSVSICEECGSKRPMPESFLNVSLPLEERTASGVRGNKVPMSLERCLQQFTLPEALADPVHCPSCQRKTPTKKQHTFAKLPKILCLHLKRFDAAKNRKIDDFVSFPARGLEMGKLLPHWYANLSWPLLHHFE